MAKLKIGLKFNPGRVGSPMDKLGEFASQMEKFLRALTNDLGVEAKKGKWLAENFDNGSVIFDGEFSESVSDESAIRAMHALEALSSLNPIEAVNRNLVSHPTISEFAKVGKVLDADEVFFMRIYPPDGLSGTGIVSLDWRPVSHKVTSEIRQLLDAPYTSYGSVQGVIHAWHKGAMPPFFTLRELAEGNALVRCEYPDKVYHQIHEATKSPRAVAHVYGDISWDRVTSQTLKVAVEDIEVMEPLKDLEFDSLFGSIPNATDDLSTADYISWLRDDEE